MGRMSIGGCEGAVDGRRRLPGRDLSPVEPLLPVVRTLVNGYFRAEVRGLERVPDGPVLFVGNHSGGFGSPDSVVFILAFLDRFGVDRPLYWLGHSLLMSVPILSEVLARFGTIVASPDSAKSALASGGSVVVYPGGEVELHRPWSQRHDVKFLGHQGFLRLARETGVPIVPVVAEGGHSNAFIVTDGRWLARALRLDRLFNLKVLPISFALPWGVNVGDLLGHIALPVRIRVEVLHPIDVRDTFDGDLDAAYDHVTSTMQRTLDRLAAS